jgi:hypothetical protein
LQLRPRCSPLVIANLEMTSREPALAR